VRGPQAGIPAVEITQLHLDAPPGTLRSDAARWAQSRGLLLVERADDYLLTVLFDEGRTGNAADFRPDLPLVCRW
jgi:hypothetical protein